MKKKSIKINMILNGIKGVLSILFPLITFPYVTRILGVEEIGKFNFANSIINYIILLAGLGISTYAVREGSKYRENSDDFQKFSNEIFSINLLSTLFSYLLLVLIIIFVPKMQSYFLVILILSLQVIFTTLGVEWIYSIYEDYLYITIRSILFQLLSIAMLFLFVHSENDLIIYTLIIVISSVGSNILNFFHSKKYCNLKLVRNINLKKHIIPILIFFSSQIAITIYVNSDITILGFLKNDYTVGIYSVSTKIYTLVKRLLSSMIVVSIPRLSYLVGNNKMKEFKKVAEDVYKTTLTVVVPAIIGIILLRKELILIISGEKYIQASSSLFILSIALLFSLGSYFWSQCVMVPNSDEKLVLKITILGAVVNVILNFALIPFFSENAAAFTTVLSEGITFYLFKKNCNDYLKIKGLYVFLLKIILGCIPIVLLSYIIKIFITNVLIYIILLIVLSIIIYFLLELLLKNESLNFLRNILKKVKKLD